MNTDLQLQNTTNSRGASAPARAGADSTEDGHAPFSQHLEAAQSDETELETEETEADTSGEAELALADESDGGSVSEHGESRGEGDADEPSREGGEQATDDEPPPSFRADLAAETKRADAAREVSIAEGRGTASIGSMRSPPASANERAPVIETAAGGSTETAPLQATVAGRTNTPPDQLAPTEAARAATRSAPPLPAEVADDWAARAMSNRARLVVGSGDDRVALLVALEKEGVRVALEASSQETADQARSSANQLERALGRHGKQLLELQTNSETEKPESAADQRATRRSIIA